MIRYALRCKDGHEFDGWFRSADDFEALRVAGQVTCAMCGVAQVEKALMAPSLPAAKAPATTTPREVPPLERLREMVEKHSSYVGPRFAAEARAMHEGRVPERAIHGEANLQEARQLLDDGIEVAPLPFAPRQKMN